MNAKRNSADTIAAIATAPGSGAIAIVRVSGPAATAIGESLAGGPIRPRAATLRTIRTAAGDVIDEGLVLSFPGPHSYTGEDLIEFQIHGGTVVSDWLLRSVLAAGARPASPGEFTLRAFLNDKLDLAQAEAVADLVASQSRTGAAAARRSLEGRFSRRIEHLQQQLTALRVQLEAHLDFPDEDIEPAERAQMHDAATGALQEIDALRSEARNGVVL
ncbi:MAG TPA: tRNA uridine-5-carboxymethylaminomethyl(34) synthesis GTPase MnmE, partial [Gammaproteobacteria bacterium]|nr:tRNA uridine-5-carboxymethylaminomethyl(34) synthesis GTPase MnmE [Gammaproteobacteria bacterium]